MHEGSRKAIVAAFLANAGIAVAKFVGFAFTRSASLLAEAVHSVADAGNQALLFLGGARARRTATAEHPFGFGRERYFWAFVVAVVLFTLGSFFALYEGMEKLRHPHETESLAWAYGILGFAILLELFSFRTAVREANHVRRGAGWWQFIRRSKEPELPVVVLEDSGALLGLVFAIVGVFLSDVTGNPRWDAVGSLAIGLLLGVIAIVLMIEMKGLLIGESAAPDVQEQIVRAVESSTHVVRVIHQRTQHLGPDELLVGVKAEFAPTLSVTELTAAIDHTETVLRDAVPSARIVYIEPDVMRG